MPIKTFAQAEEVLSTRLSGFESRPQQQAMATRVEEALSLPGGQSLVEAGCGCIQGDAEIIVNRGGNGRRYPLWEVVAKFNGEKIPAKSGGALRDYGWDLSIPTFVQREAEDGTVRLGRLVNAWRSGVKTTYTVTTDAARTIRATDEHPFLTERGWLRLDELVIGDEVHVRGSQATGATRQPKPLYVRVFSMQAHPYANRFKNGSAMVPLHRLAVEADLNGLAYEVFVDKIIAGDASGLEFLDPKVWAVHHKDHDSRNNDLSNLQILSHPDHHRLHAEEGKTRNVLYKVTTERVVSVEYHGEEETYDLEVADDPHNFMANGFVVHNTGKSLAALIPVILSGRRAIYATATIALMNQIANKDLPFLEANLGVPFTWALVKGRSNYLCLAKVSALADPSRVPALPELLAAIEAETDHSGDREDLPSMTPAEWAQISSSAAECPGKKECPFGSTCFSEAAKARAKEVNVVITNTAMLMTDLKVREMSDGYAAMLGSYDVVVVDEAHELEDIATSQLSDDLRAANFEFLVRDIRSFLNTQQAGTGSDGQDVLEGATNLFTILPVAGPRESGRVRLPWFVQHEADILPILTGLSALTQLVASTTIRNGGEKETARRAILIRRIDNLYAKLSLSLTADDSDLVRYVTTEEKVIKGRKSTVKTLTCSPLRVGPFLDRHLWNRTKTNRDGETIPSPLVSLLVSATLSVAGSFRYVTDRLGLEDASTLSVGTPFNYKTQSLLYVPAADVASPKNTQGWLTYTGLATLEMIDSSKGGALLLFTSRKSMQNSYDILAERLADKGLTVLMQGVSGTNKEIARIFQEDTHSVLFALKSFFTGVDFAGETCRLVAIDKLPFAVPTDPMFEARSEEVERNGGSSFTDLSIPAMILTLTQGFGRLIRSKNDRGVVAILDSRLSGTAWGRKIVDALPEAPATTSLSDVRSFYEGS